MLRVGTHSLRPVQKATPTFTQKRFRRYAPGMVIPEGKVTRQTGVRDLLVTSVYSVQRPWRWIKSYRRRLLGELQYVVNPSLMKTVAQLQDYIKTEDWQQLPGHDPQIKERIETLVAKAKDRE